MMASQGGGMMPSQGGMGGQGLATAMGGSVYGETTTEGLGSRLCDSIGKACACLVFGIPLITLLCMFNEFNLVKSEATADLVGTAHVIQNCEPTPDFDKKLVYASCSVTAPELATQLPDVLTPFIPSFEGADLVWNLEIYQYTESKHQDCRKNNDGSKTCTTTYSYSAGWHSNPVDSNAFHAPQYSNQGTDFPPNLHASGSIKAPERSVIMHNAAGDKAAFALPEYLALQLPVQTINPVSSGGGYTPWGGGSDIYPANLHVSGKYLVSGPGNRIGDIRISFQGRYSPTASVAARQLPWTQSPWFQLDYYPPQKFDFWGRTTYQLARLEGGTESKKTFIQNYHNENKVVAWAIRIATLVLMCSACCTILSPFSVAADAARILNYCTCFMGTFLAEATQAVVGLMGCGLGCACWSIVVALSWLFVHPTLSIGLILLAVGGVVASSYVSKTMTTTPSAKQQGLGKQDSGKKEEPKGKHVKAREGYVALDGPCYIDTKKVQPIAHVV